MAHGHHHAAVEEVQVVPADPAKIKKILVTTAILGVVTAIEFALAFGMSRGPLLVSIFVILTLVKSFYIIGEFMHLKYETKSLIMCIVSPVLFILWLIAAMLIESDHVLYFLHMYWWD